MSNSDAIMINNKEQLLNTRWKTKACYTGESCWCRLIVPEEDTTWESGDEVFIAPNGTLYKETAEHIVQIHNDWLATLNSPQENLEQVVEQQTRSIEYLTNILRKRQLILRRQTLIDACFLGLIIGIVAGTATIMFLKFMYF